MSVGDVSVLPSDRRSIAESAAEAASADPSSGEVGPRAIRYGCMIAGVHAKLKSSCTTEFRGR